MRPYKGIEILLMIKRNRIQPEKGIFWKMFGDVFFFRRVGSFKKGRIDFCLIHFFNGKLGIAVENFDIVYLVSEKGEPVRLVDGIGKNIHDASAEGILSGLTDKIHLLETFLKQ